MSENNQGSKALSPPYVPYPSFKTMIAGFKEHDLPSRIDRSVLSNFSGIVGSQLRTALRFLELVDANDTPKEQLRALVEAYGSEQWPNVLGNVLDSAYGLLFDLDLKTASPAQFHEHFRSLYPGEGSTLRKTLTFFLSAAKDAQIPISPYIMKNKKPRSAPTKRIPKAAGSASGSTEKRTEKDKPADIRHHDATKTPYEVLMNDIYDPTDMDAGSEEEKAVFTLARYLKTREAA